MAESNELCITAAKPDGRGEFTSAKSFAAENTQSTRLRGFPFEGLQFEMQSGLNKEIPRGNSSIGKIIISQELDTDCSIQNEARSQLEGVASENYLNVPYT